MNTLYTIFLAAHNILRWIILLLAINLLVRMSIGWIKKTPWKTADQKAGTYFTISMDTQLLLGLALYFVLSPLTKGVFQDFGAAMSNDILRFFGVEHFLIMVIAIALAHYTNSFTKKDLPDEKKFKRATILYAIVILLIIAGIPWSTRPLIPMF